jgi:Flp pilus assembly protein TadD
MEKPFLQLRLGSRSDRVLGYPAPPREADSMHDHRRIRDCLVLAAAITLLYAPSLANQFVYDDHEVIEVQPRPTGVGDLARVFAEPHFRGLPYYRPVVRASLLAQKAVHGDVPALFHLGNALLAGIAAVAAFALLRAPRLGIDRGPAWWAAFVFAAHPVASSAVYPIASGRETLLPAVLILAALAAWLRDRRGVALACYGASLFAKEQAAVVPLLFVLADLCGVAEGAAPLRVAQLRTWLQRYAGIVAVTLAYGAVRLRVLGPTHYELAVLDDPGGPLLSLLFGAQVALAPFGQLHYEPERALWFAPLRAAIAAGLVAALALLARGAGAPTARIALFWAGWFVATQLPTANLLRQEAPFDERYAFLAMLAFPAVAAASATALGARPRARRVAIAAGVAIAIALAAVTWRRSAAFRDDAAFAAQWLRTNPASPEAHHLLAVLATEAGRFDEAVTHYRDALRAAPDSPDLHVNLAVALAQLGHEDEARRELETALRLDPGHPEAHATLGTLLARAGRLEEAVAHHREAVRAAPRMAAAHQNLGAALARLGRYAEAEAEFREALRLDPHSIEVVQNLAAALRAQGRNAEADALLRSGSFTD